ncbi:MAG: AAA family ATPase, partial [Spirochaetaceae bacterium]|nr:AAA family ATPase [Spirochaetaceae bacterium]
EIDSRAGNVVMTVRPSMMQDLRRISDISGGTLIYSMWEGYRENDSTKRFLANLAQCGAEITTIHTSGHADYYTLQKMVDTVRPRHLIPIHTFEGSRYQSFFPEVAVKNILDGEKISKTEETRSGAGKRGLLERMENLAKLHMESGAISGLEFEQFAACASLAWPHIGTLCETFKINEIQAVLLADMAYIFDGTDIALKDISQFIDCMPLKLLMEHLDELKALERRGFITIKNDKGGFSVGLNVETLTDLLKEKASKRPVKGIKPPDKIISKKLFYPEKTAHQVAELTGLLHEENFSAIRKRLSGDGMRTGFACLFSGCPGTGKTETVYQIARETGRGIMEVDISNIKDMWFGESEKKIKAVFTNYRKAANNSPVVPILLFNEADAVIGKRQTLHEMRNGPGQTENAIQNIILQEIENLDGILIATTNLIKNLDTAFERRFLYKIDFEKPTLQIRKSIWQALVPGLSAEEAATLAEKFDFSGGQIENIARRRTVAGILYGAEPSVDTLIGYCAEETIPADKPRPIGF